MSLTYDDLAVCRACGTVRPRDALVLLDTADAGPVRVCRDAAACRAGASGAVTGSPVPDTATGVGLPPTPAPTRLTGAGSRPDRDWRAAATAWLVLALVAAAGLVLVVAATWEVGR